MRRSPVQTSDLETEILKRVRESNGISRVQVARDLGLAPSTTGIYVERLIADGFLTETEAAARMMGRPPRLLRMNPDGGEFIGVDFEARNIMAVAVDFSDKPLRNSHKLIEESDSVPQIIAKIEEAIAEMMPERSSRLLAIGVGVPGVVDSSKGVAIHYKYIAHWRNVPLAAHLRKRFGVPVFLENNARSMALAEMWFGQGRGIRDFLCIGIRSGIGVGIVLDGHLQRGSNFGAGELGRWRVSSLSERRSHLVFEQRGRLQGHELQEISSARAILNALRTAVGMGNKSVLRKGSRAISLQEVTQAAQQRDALTLRVISEAATALGNAIGHLALVLNPAKAILAGPLTPLGETFLKPVRDEVALRLEAAGISAPEILNSTMGEFSGALGAAALALHEWKPSPAVKASDPQKKSKLVQRVG